MALKRVNPLVKLALAAVLSVAVWFLDVGRIGYALGLALLTLLATAGAHSPRRPAFYRTSVTVGSLITVTWTLSRYLAGGATLMEALPQGLMAALRFFVTTGWFFAVVETTSPGAMLAACAAARLPSRLALNTALVLGLISLFQEEYQAVTETQRARGVELERGPLRQRVRHVLGTGLPLLMHSLDVAESIAIALSLYGYDPQLRRSTWRLVGVLTMEERLMIDGRETPCQAAEALQGATTAPADEGQDRHRVMADAPSGGRTGPGGR